MKNVGLIACGLLIAFIGQFFGLMLAGAGHGWNTPLWMSFVLWAAYPVALMRAEAADRRYFDNALLILGFFADAGLIAFTFVEGVQYFVRFVKFPGAWWAIAVWMAIWLGWQILAAVRLIRPRGAIA